LGVNGPFVSCQWTVVRSASLKGTDSIAATLPGSEAPQVTEGVAPGY